MRDRPTPRADAADDRRLENLAPIIPLRPEEEEEIFARLPRPRRQPSMLIAVAALLLCGYLMIDLRVELRYAFSSRAPLAIAPGREIAAMPDNRLASLRARPDRRNAVIVRGRGTGRPLALYRIPGSGGCLLLQQPHRHGRESEPFSDDHAGRLRLLDRLPYAGAARHYLASERIQRVIAPASQGAGSGLRDTGGDPIAASADDPVLVREQPPGKTQLDFDRGRYSCEADVRTVLAELGLAAEPLEPTPRAYRFVVAQSAFARPEVERRLTAPETRVVASPQQVEHRLRFGQLRFLPQGLELPGRPPIPYAQVRALLVEQRAPLCPQAMVLAAGETPGSFWYYPALYLGLLGIFVFNLRGLLLGWQGRRKPEQR